jgi:hypothetical protein
MSLDDLMNDDVWLYLAYEFVCEGLDEDENEEEEQ